jgi:hypothetical protein
MKNKVLIFSLSLILVTAVSCKKTDEAVTGSADTATAASTSEIPGTTSPNDLNPVSAQAYIDDVTIGHEVGADGTIPTGKTGDDFASGETVKIAMKVKDAPAGTAVKTVFFAKDEKNVGEKTMTIAGGEKFLVVEQATTGWPQGDYRADIFVGDEKVNSQQFQIVPAAGAGK